MTACSHCGKEIEVDRFFTRKSVCPKCGSDLHVCLNCRFYAPSAHNRCAEPKAEFQRSRDRANFCDYFVFGQSRGGASASKDDVMKALNDLFKK